jgi:hypothetical protein
MAANLLQRRWGGSGTKVTLIESSEIGIIGVGEGSTPQLKAFFDELGVSEAEWMPRCNATYKAGIEFVGWSDRPGHERYFHPFPSAVDPFTEQSFFTAAALRRQGADVPAHPDPFYLATRIARAGRAPLAPSNFPFRIGYGYHFDAHLVGATLRDIAVAAGVRHEIATIAEVTLTEAGDIADLVADDGWRFAADLFVDASGFRATLIEVRSRNATCPLPTICSTTVPSSCRPPCRIGSASDDHRHARQGWLDLAHPTDGPRRQRLRLFQPLHRPQDAADELRAHVGAAPDAEVRHLKMRCGRVERSWVRNCLAIGLSQGFSNPWRQPHCTSCWSRFRAFTEAYERGDRSGFNTAIARRYEASATISCAITAPRSAETRHIGATPPVTIA